MHDDVSCLNSPPRLVYTKFFSTSGMYILFTRGYSFLLFDALGIRQREFVMKFASLTGVDMHKAAECRKPKTKAITMANHNKHKHHNENLTQIHVTGGKMENAREQVAIGFGLASDWLSSVAITERSKANPKKIRIIFDTVIHWMTV